MVKPADDHKGKFPPEDLMATKEAIGEITVAGIMISRTLNRLTDDQLWLYSDIMEETVANNQLCGCPRHQNVVELTLAISRYARQLFEIRKTEKATHVTAGEENTSTSNG